MKVLLPRFFIVAFGMVASVPSFAQSANSNVPHGAQTPSINFHVIQTCRVKQGEHSITYNRVAPPTLSTASPGPQPVASGTVSPEEPPKPFQSIFFSATVYDNQITDLRWSDGTQCIRAFSNINFNYFCGFAQFETADTLYSYWMIADNETSRSADPATRNLLGQARQQLPNLSISPNAPSSYVIVGDDSSSNSEACSALDAIHAYYNANRAPLIQDYQKRIATEAAQTKWLSAHPPVQADTVINFWRIPNASSVKGGN